MLIIICIFLESKYYFLSEPKMYKSCLSELLQCPNHRLPERGEFYRKYNIVAIILTIYSEKNVIDRLKHNVNKKIVAALLSFSFW